MSTVTIARLRTRMRTYDDLLAVLPPEALATELPVPSNRVGSQLWCVIGARESYARAIKEGRWAGFSCSLTGADTQSFSHVVATLESSASVVDQSLEVSEWTPEREEFLLDLLEHEAQHQGQLIRYVYGLGYTFPESWRARWALS
jgi:hypothetical protein